MRRSVGLRLGLFAAALSCGPRPEAPTTTSPPETPVASHSAFEAYATGIRDPASRTAAIAQLREDIARHRGDGAWLDGFAEELVPALAEAWDEFPDAHGPLLVAISDAGRPEAALIWNRMLDAGDNVHVLQCLLGIQVSQAAASAAAVLALLTRLRADASADSKGELRATACQTLGALRHRAAVGPLLELLEASKESQPVRVHRAAAEALGKIGDPAAVDGLLAAPFRVQDVLTTNNLGEVAKRALARMGESSVGPTVRMLRGEQAVVQELAAEHGFGQATVTFTAARILGATGSATAVDPLLAAFPRDCDSRGEQQTHRAVIANALGFLGAVNAAGPLCACAVRSKDPFDHFAMVEALGRIGGSTAVSCLARVIRDGEYNSDLAQPGLELEPRWEAARFAILAATPADVPTIRDAMRSNKDPTVKKHLAAWDDGLAVLERCKADAECYAEAVADANASWFARETAAFSLARFAPGDELAATVIANAFSVPNPEARVSMAWLPPKMLGDTKCPACVDAMKTVLSSERGKMTAKYRLSVITARISIARLEG